MLCSPTLCTLNSAAPTWPPGFLSIPCLLRYSQLIAPARRSLNSRPINAVAPTSSTALPHRKVLIPIGYGTEEMEAVIMADVLRRAGAEVTVASVEPEQLEVETSGGIRLVADTYIGCCSDETFDLVALPGGMPGSARLRDSQVLRDITIKHAEEKRLYSAICAAPAVALLPWGLLRRKQVTGHPAFMDKLPRFWAVKSNTHISGELTTSRGPGTAFEFALTSVKQLFGETVADEVRDLLILAADGDHPRKEELNEEEWAFDHIPSVLIPVASGSEMIEVVIIVDILRRANINVVVASVEGSQQISSSQGTKIVADQLIDKAAQSTYDLIILPGEVAGLKQLKRSKDLKKLLKQQEASGRVYGATSSSVVLLQKIGLLKDKRVSAHSSIVDMLKGKRTAVGEARVVIDGKLITGKGLACVTDFALAIVHKLFGHARARSVAEGLVLEYPRRS
ncbi:hypothetical protein V2J09_000158 [Rumex salicifolius]